MEILSKVNFTLKETINAGSATNVLKNYAGKVLKVTGLMIAKKTELDEETGEIKETKIGVLKTPEELISSISPTTLGSIDTIINVFTENNMLADIEKGIDVQVKAGKSGKNREFFYLELV